jgi:hypothetical protein
MKARRGAGLIAFLALLGTGTLAAQPFANAELAGLVWDTRTSEARLADGTPGGKTAKLQDDILVSIDKLIKGAEGDVQAELRLLRALQQRVNTRTVAIARLFPGERVPKGADEARNELKVLAERQSKIAALTQGLAGLK